MTKAHAGSFVKGLCPDHVMAHGARSEYELERSLHLSSLPPYPLCHYKVLHGKLMGANQAMYVTLEHQRALILSETALKSIQVADER